MPRFSRLPVAITRIRKYVVRDWVHIIDAGWHRKLTGLDCHYRQMLGATICSVTRLRTILSLDDSALDCAVWLLRS